MLARQLVIGFGIAVIFPLLVYYGFCTITPPPRYQNFDKGGTIFLPPTATTEERNANLKLQRQQREAYEAAARQFTGNLLLAAAPLGLAAILVGYFVGLGAIGSGLMLGGIITVAFGYWGYWSFLENWMRFASLLLGFIMLLFVGYQHFGASRLPQRGAQGSPDKQSNGL